MKDLLLVGAGGFLGSIGRYALAGAVQRLSSYPTFPYGTLCVNVLGCLVIGVLGGLAEARGAFSPAFRLFVFIGILGGFTTFSSFSFETLQLARSADMLRAGLNVMVQVAGCLCAAWGGFALARGM